LNVLEVALYLLDPTLKLLRPGTLAHETKQATDAVVQIAEFALDPKNVRVRHSRRLPRRLV
jgi:hypothetical protein